MRHLIAVSTILIVAWNVAADDVDVVKTIERIKEDAAKASKKLDEKDPGAGTQQLQKDVLQRIDELIRKAKEPPPMSNSSAQTKSDPSSMTKNGGSSAAAQRKERREKNSQASNGGTQPKANAPMPRLDPSPSQASTRPMLNDKNEPLRPAVPLRITDTYKDAWGHLPEKVRQEMDLYFREQFMPRYSELLRQYYSSLAERNSRSDP